MRLHQVAGAGTQRFAYDGLDMIAEYNGADALERRFVFGPGIDEPIVWYEGGGTTDRRFLHADERGSIVAVSDASGNVLAKNSFDEFGTPGSANAGRFQYTGQAWLSEIGAIITRPAPTPPIRWGWTRAILLPAHPPRSRPFSATPGAASRTPAAPAKVSRPGSTPPRRCRCPASARPSAIRRDCREATWLARTAGNPLR